jgi:hypothetical protein
LGCEFVGEDTLRGVPPAGLVCWVEDEDLWAFAPYSEGYRSAVVCLEGPAGPGCCGLRRRGRSCLAAEGRSDIDRSAAADFMHVNLSFLDARHHRRVCLVLR